jgi:hypothetical protein
MLSWVAVDSDSVRIFFFEAIISVFFSNYYKVNGFLDFWASN